MPGRTVDHVLREWWHHKVHLGMTASEFQSSLMKHLRDNGYAIVHGMRENIELRDNAPNR